MLLSQAAWPEVEARIADGKRGVIIPIGSHEQHGPTGLIGTDALCPQIIALEAEKESDLCIAPTFSVGMAQHHMAFPGPMTLRPSTMIAAMVDWTHSLARAGFERFYWFNGHGGNIATIEAAFAESYQPWSVKGEAATYAHKLMNWWRLPGVEKLCNQLFPVGHGSHATPSEVAVTYMAYPERVTLARQTLDPKIAPTGPIRDAADYRRRFPDGRIGSDPLLATVELGGRIVEAAKAALATDAASFFGESA
jgi:creatinine amidohydrolase/Fe(II)-dependent formamide hydrolase-like protein